MGKYEDIKDVVLGKLVYKTLNDSFASLSEKVFGEGVSFSEDECRKRFYGAKSVIDAIEKDRVDNVSDPGLLDEISKRSIELDKQKQKFFDQRTAYSKVIRDRSREEEVNELIAESIAKANLPKLDYSRMISESSDNDMIVCLSDIHFGAVVNNRWRKYDSAVCVEMMKQYLNKILMIADRHKTQNCYVIGTGDYISGNIHYGISVTNKENVVEQVVGVSELVSEFIAHLSQHFESVYFVSVPGNHSRLNPNKKQTVASERLDDIVPWYTRARLANFENVHVETERVDDTIAQVEIRGKTYCCVHGDFDMSDQKIQDLKMMVDSPVYAVICGHRHHNKTDYIQGVRLVMCGGFIGMDDHCVQNRIMSVPEQMVCICNESGIVCEYPVDLEYVCERIKND